jgi:tetratricopeptide (TPR) repeat protein
MAGPRWENVYDLSDEQINQLDQAEQMMEMMQLNEAEKILNEMLKENPDCIPALNNLGHLHGRHMSDFELAIEYYDRVISIEPDNAWARDERRRYRRYLSYD